jgi:hypothetical protein
MHFADGFFLSGIMNWLMASPWWLALLFGWSVTPGMMFVLGWTLEGRTLPIRENSRAFLPGDFFLGTLLASSVALLNTAESSASWWTSYEWLWVVFVGTTLVSIAVNALCDWPHYGRRQLLSPTKLWHEFVIFCLYGSLLIGLSLPAFVYGELSVFGILLRIAQLGSLAVWVAGLWWDGTRVKLDPEKLHPTDWGWPHRLSKKK